jgi:uncharacterized protein
MKLLILIIVIGAVYFLFIKKKPSNINNKQNNSKKQTPKANDMLECQSCGIYCEMDDMLLSNSKYYCSKECVNKG